MFTLQRTCRCTGRTCRCARYGVNIDGDDEHEWKTNETGIDVDVVFESSKVEDCP